MAFSNTIVNSYRSRGYQIYFNHLSSGRSVSFDCYITSFSDSYQPSYGDVIEGGVDIQSTFKSITFTERKISISLDIPSIDLGSAKINLSKIQKLARFLYPTVSSNAGNTTNSITGSPSISVKMLNLICDYDGSPVKIVIDKVSIAPVVENGFFDPGANLLYPKTLKLDLSFTVFTNEPDPSSLLKA